MQRRAAVGDVQRHVVASLDRNGVGLEGEVASEQPSLELDRRTRRGGDALVLLVRSRSGLTNHVAFRREGRLGCCRGSGAG